MEYDIAVIGGGPGGYTAAEKAAEKGFRVILFEKNALGGTCLNQGCIPTKALLHAAESYAALSEAKKLGIHTEQLSYDFGAMHRRKNEVIAKLRQGIEKLMKSCRVTVIEGNAQITGPHTVTCNGTAYEAADIIAASGSRPFLPPIPGIELPGVYTSSELLEGEGIALSSLIIIGGGVIGVECASIYLPLGCRVTILEAADHILPPMDREIAQRLTMQLKKRGCAVTTGVSIKAIYGKPGEMSVTYLDKKGAEITASAEGILIAAGRRADAENLFSPGAEPELEHGAVKADELGRTSIPHLYVIGDARAHNTQLAHVAEAQAENVVAVIAGEQPPVDEHVIPSCIYCSPEIASVGMTEEQARSAGYSVKTKKYLTGANGKCLIEGAEGGYVKLVADGESGALLGAQLVCPRATDLIGELALAVKEKLTIGQIRSVIHPHPSFCEMISGAAKLQ